MAKKSFKGTGADLFFSDAPTPTQTEIMAKDLKINPAFQALIPPLSHAEKAQLEENLLRNGIREALSLWGETIIDGHNRYEIAQKHHLTYTTVSYEFENESDVVLWIVQNQFGRRNLSAYDRSQLALRLKPIIAAKAKENQVKAGGSVLQKSVEAVGGGTVPQKSVEAPIDTQKALAKIASVSHDTISKVEKLERSASQEVKDRLKHGDISINKAYQDILRKEKREEMASSAGQPEPPEGKFDVIYADPWQREWAPSTSLKNIKALEIPSEDDAVLFLWSTAPKLREALDIMKAWGFDYKTCAAWDRKKPAAGHWFRDQHDLLLVGTKGSARPPEEDEEEPPVSSVYREAGTPQGKKPGYYYRIIELMYPDRRYLEVFGRHGHNERWTVWGI